MKAQVGPASKECKTDAEVDALLKKNEVVVISYLTDKADQGSVL
jgi:nitroimidazol reductase NimA-like FMN-containing flavoprotein (pyridoxamine 5'-phosphate oxidase superfamily)